MRPSIVFFAVGKFYNLICEITNKDYRRYNIQVFKYVFEKAIDVARKIEKEGNTDIIITAGSTYKLLSKHLSIPIIPIKISGFDLLTIIREASAVDNDIILLNYENKIAELDTIADLLRVKIHQCIYMTQMDIYNQVDSLLKKGHRTFVGTGTVCDYVDKKSAISFLIYRTDAISQSIDMAINIYNDKNRELERTKTLEAILEFCSDGIIATNENGVITAFNPSASNIIKFTPHNVIGSNINKVFTDSNMLNVLKIKEPQYHEIHTVRDVKIIINRVPIIVNQEIKGMVITFQDGNSVQQAEQVLRKKLYAKGYMAHTNFNDMVGISSIFSDCVAKSMRYASSDFTITISGETGTGKELFAQSIHNASQRKQKPFIAINCAALPENLLESELFGYEEGAFTGAKKGGKTGMFELAHGGTIFLDEIFEIPLNLQARLLRVLQEKEIMRLGGQHVIPVDVRIIAATNKTLQEQVDIGKFRSDLFFRINVLNINIPPLRERKEDIYLLFQHFVKQHNPMILEHVIKYKDDLNSILNSYHWPGNVRELNNLSMRFVILARQNNIIESINALRSDLLSYSSIFNRDVIEGRKGANYRAANHKQLHKEIDELLKVSGGNKAELARTLRISRTTLWRWLNSSK